MAVNDRKAVQPLPSYAVDSNVVCRLGVLNPCTTIILPNRKTLHCTLWQPSLHALAPNALFIYHGFSSSGGNKMVLRASPVS